MDREKRDEGGSKQAGTKDLIDINLGNGDVWWSTRLYLIVALAEDYFGIKHINFLEECDGQENCFIGLATPRAILRDLTVADPRLERAYRTAYDSVTNEKRDTAVFVKPDRNNILIEEVINLMTLYVSQFDLHGSEKQLAKWVTKPLLKQWLGQNLKMASVECKGIGVNVLILHPRFSAILFNALFPLSPLLKIDS